jgi:hypothetical protein
MRNNINLELLGVALQIYNLLIIMQDFNNTDILQELQRQDKEYLETILKNQKEIIQLLKERR